MTFSFRYSVQAQWPRQAWLVALEPGTATIDVWCGAGVELDEAWFCEAVWDGVYQDGNFDATDVVAGSGVRVRGDRVIFVSSGSTVDRLQWTKRGDTTLVSNSLACLASHLTDTPLAAYPHYLRDFYSVVRGVRGYRQTLPLVDGVVELVYFDNIEWRDGVLTRIAKPCAERRFGDYDDYSGFLKRSLDGMVANMSDASRRRPYRLLGTLSTGYDSTAVTALARPAGLGEVICFERESGRDSGSQIAHHFRVRPISVNMRAWRRAALPEVPFIAADAFGEEVHFAAASEVLSDRVLLTGYHGDKVWERDTPYLSPDLVRGDLSGLALTEYRLQAGFINCPVPFWGARSVRDIVGISRSDGMKRWQRNGDYNRPICRRIVESTGVPGDAFGQVKSHASQWIALGNLGLTEMSLQDYSGYLDRHKCAFLRSGRVPPTLAKRWSALIAKGSYELAGALSAVPAFYKLGLHHMPILAGLTGLRTPNPPHPPMVLGLARYLFPWALQHATKCYGRVC